MSEIQPFNPIKMKRLKNDNIVTSYKVVPNPNNVTFELITSSNNAVKGTVFDDSGRMIENGNYKPIGNKILFNFNMLTKDIYHLKVVDNLKVSTFKIIIN